MLDWLTKAVNTVLSGVRHPTNWGWSWAFLNRTRINYEGEVRADANSIIMACVRWVQRTFSEAPPITEQWVAAREEWATVQRHPMLDLLSRPNSYYNGIALWKATVADMMLSGNAYWLKVRSSSGKVVQLWWLPSVLVVPKGDEVTFITHYEFRPDPTKTYEVRERDIVHFRDGMDPLEPRRGLSPIRSLFREVFTDDEAANMTASLLKNMGVPGVIISPEAGAGSIPKDAATAIKDAYKLNFGGDLKGEPLVLEGATKIQQFGFSPEQMQLRSLRGIPEERITAVLGVNAAVVGLGAGLATTKVGATLKEYREEAMESTVIPMYREYGDELTHQLLPDFIAGTEWRMGFDLTKVRVLADDENKRHERVRGDLEAGYITVAEARRETGRVALPEHEVYLRQRSVGSVPANLSPEEQAAMAEPAAAPSGEPKSNGHVPAALIGPGRN
jgi:HK97 family phage portal protein